MAIHAGIPAPSLAPRLGQDAFKRRGDVAYRVLESRSLLGRCSSQRMPFEWTVNPYRGCAMGCRYCYATYTHEYIGLTNPDEFHTAVWVKRGGEAETARRLRLAVTRGERIAIGTATDPYQPGEPDEAVTRRFLALCAQHRGIRLGLITKGALVLRDLDLLCRIHQLGRLSISVSLISTDAELLRRLEPWAPPPLVRLEVLRRLAEAGLDVALAALPILPGLTDDEATLDALLARVAAAGVRRFNAGLLFLRSPTRERYLAFIEREFPRLAEAYRRAYTDRVYLGGSYRERVLARVDQLAAKHGLQRSGEYGSATGRLGPPSRSQLALFT